MLHERLTPSDAAIAVTVSYGEAVRRVVADQEAYVAINEDTRHLNILGLAFLLPDPIGADRWKVQWASGNFTDELDRVPPQPATLFDAQLLQRLAFHRMPEGLDPATVTPREIVAALNGIPREEAQHLPKDVVRVYAFDLLELQPETKWVDDGTIKVGTHSWMLLTVYATFILLGLHVIASPFHPIGKASAWAALATFAVALFAITPTVQRHLRMKVARAVAAPSEKKKVGYKISIIPAHMLGLALVTVATLVQMKG